MKSYLTNVKPKIIRIKGKYISKNVYVVPPLVVLFEMFLWVL